MVVTEEERRPIVQLDDATIGHIAAGEVVERPAQVVKELIENSIDAGSTRIRVEVERGGFDRLAVIDDGGGIPASELALAATRHATSKLVRAEDLAAIHTLGFRGEALASIGMVSHLTIQSRPEGNPGARLEVVEGKLGEISPAGIAPGTSIEVRDIFANLPARLNFQKRPSTETSAIVDIVVAQALCHPDIGFVVDVDGRTVVDTPRSARMQDRLFDLLGESSEKLVPLEVSDADAAAPGEEAWRGWISPPELTRSRASDVHVVINGRPVGNAPFLQSIRRGYHSRLMVGRNPICVLFLDLPADEVDVNVHPTKREVRLRHSWRVLERLERAIQHTLLSLPTGPMTAPDIPIESVEGPATKPDVEASLPSWASPAVDKLTEAKPMVQTRIAYTGAPVDRRAPKPAPKVSESPLAQATLSGLDVSDVAPALSSAERDLHRYAGRGEATSPLDEPTALELEVTEVPAMEPLAQFADSYILAQGGDELFIIDQHALHERVRYQRLRESMVSWTPQPLLAPIPLAVSPARQELIRQRGEDFAKIGFAFEITTEVQLTQVPEVLLGTADLSAFIDEVLDEMETGATRFDAVESMRDEIAFMRACRGSVKANQRLSLPEMRRLLADMRTIEHPWACVHGRPTVMRITLDSMDAHFGRHG